MKVIGIIPARFASTRFPGKPLADINGKPMIQWVYEGCLKCGSLNDVYVATDDDRIQKAVIAFGGKSIMTSPKCKSGTERVYDAMAYASLEADIIVNIQGDEPGIISQQIDELVAPFKDESVDISTLCIAFDKRDNISNPNKVKVVIGVNRNAMMFSRLPIPYNINNKIQVKYFKHIGLYAYRAKVLKKLIKLQETPLEKAESLEQLRWLENGYSIYIKETMIESQSVDTPEDLKSFIKSL